MPLLVPRYPEEFRKIIFDKVRGELFNDATRRRIETMAMALLQLANVNAGVHVDWIVNAGGEGSTLILHFMPQPLHGFGTDWWQKSNGDFVFRTTMADTQTTGSGFFETLAVHAHRVQALPSNAKKPRDFFEEGVLSEEPWSYERRMHLLLADKVRAKIEAGEVTRTNWMGDGHSLVEVLAPATAHHSRAAVVLGTPPWVTELLDLLPASIPDRMWVEVLKRFQHCFRRWHVLGPNDWERIEWIFVGVVLARGLEIAPGVPGALPLVRTFVASDGGRKRSKPRDFSGEGHSAVDVQDTLFGVIRSDRRDVEPWMRLLVARAFDPKAEVRDIVRTYVILRKTGSAELAAGQSEAAYEMFMSLVEAIEQQCKVREEFFAQHNPERA